MGIEIRRFIQTQKDNWVQGNLPNEGETNGLPYINGFMFIYLLITVLVISADYYLFGTYYFPVMVNYWHTYTTSIIAIILVFFLLVGLSVYLAIRKKMKVALNFWKYLHFQKIEIFDWLFLLLLLAFTLIRIAIPDTSWDTLNYHLFNQYPPFVNNITWNFFPSGVNTYIFPLGDQIFSLFRIGLGFRAGTFLNSIVVALLYFQVKDFLFSVWGIRPKFHNRLYIFSLISLCIVSTEFILANIGIYMIDILALPFIFEILRIAVHKKMSPGFVFIYSGLMAGIATAIKLNMIVFWLPLFVIIIFRYIKKINFRICLFSGISVLFPLMGYLVYNYAQTSNPIYPFINNLFHSPYFRQTFLSMTGGLKGPKNVLEILFWPFYILFNPTKTAQTGVAFYSGRITLGWILSAPLFYLGFVQKKLHLVLLSLLNYISIFLWAITAGFIRYGLFAEIVSGIIIVELVLCFIDSGKKLRKVATGLILCCFLLQVGYAYTLSFSNKVDWSLRPDFFNWKNITYYLNNFKMVGKDYSPFQGRSNSAQFMDDLSHVDYWVVLQNDDNNGYEKMLKADIPIINLGYLEATSAGKKIYYDLTSSALFRSKNKYLLSYRSTTAVEADLKVYGFYVVANEVINPTFIADGRSLRLIKISEIPPETTASVEDSAKLSISSICLPISKCTNFYGIETNSIGTKFAWTGPGTKSVIILKLPVPDKAVQIELCAVNVLQAKIRDSFQLFVNDTFIPTTTDRDKNCPIIYTGLIPYNIISKNPPQTRIEFTISETISPADIGLNVDSRKLGIAISWIMLK
jgi:hypothetical protein